MAQEVGTEIGTFQRRFGYSEISWVIDNYFAATCKKNCVIQSPDFSVSGYQLTRWRMLMKPMFMEENWFVETYLERLESDPFPGQVRVRWNLSYFYGNKDHPVTDQNCVMGKNTTIKSEPHATKLLENMISLSRYTLTVRCKLIVYNFDNETYDTPDDSGLKYLSQDMKTLCRTNKNFDTVLVVGEESIPAHKAIVCTRNSVLRAEITDDAEIVDLGELKMLEKGVARDLIGFLYSADLNYILRTPSFSMKKLVDYFKVEELRSYYLHDELTFRSNCEALVFKFKWLISGLSYTRDGCIMSPLFEVENMNLTLQLRLYPKGIGNNSEYMSLFGEFLKCEGQNGVYFSFAIQNNAFKLCRSKCQPWSSEDGTEFGLEKFVSRDILNDRTCVFKGHMWISCKLIIPSSSTVNHSVIGSKTCSIVYTNKNSHYERLSDDLLSLLETGKFSDITLRAGILLKAHKIILSYRSHVFAEMISDIGDGKVLFVRDVKPDVLRTVVRYLYTGILKNPEGKDIKELYTAAIRFSILPLQYTCSKILQENLDASNALEILALSYTAKDSKLKLATIHYICSNLQQIYEQDKWNTYRDATPGLYEELIYFVKAHICKQGGIPLTPDLKFEELIENFLG